MKSPELNSGNGIGYYSGSRIGGGTGILGVAVKCVDIKWNTSGEGESLDNS